MKRTILVLLFFLVSILQIMPYPKKSAVERYTNYQCGPCATLNAAWYNATTHDLLASNSITHIVYNVNWPGAADPMYLLNAAQNSVRWRYYGVNAVPWIVVNGSTISTDQAAMLNAVNTGNSTFSPFKIEITPERFSNNVINVKVKILRDPADVTVFTSTRLKIALTEKDVPGPSGALEAHYYDITRRMLPDAKGILFEIPSPGDSIEIETVFIPDAAFLSSVNFDSLGVVTFIQNDSTKEIYQSENAEIIQSHKLNAAFTVSGDLGGTPLTASFQDYSTPTDSTTITSHKWDFNNDGIIDSEEPSPVFTYSEGGTYTVSLKVSDGINEYTRVMPDIINALTPSADILVVNGIDYSNATYIPEMKRMYRSSAVYGTNQVDIWDLFGDQGFNYLSNTQVEKVHLFNREIPLSVMKMYDKVVWIGNNYSGDLGFFNSATVLEYLAAGGNFLFASRMASQFFDGNLRLYVGITNFTGDITVNQLTSVDTALVDMTTIGTNNYVNIFTLDPSSIAIPIFKDAATSGTAGFRMQKPDEGVFIFIAGRPYRYDTLASAQNYDKIIREWMTSSVVGVSGEENNIPAGFSLSQNYPNPFNPSTLISYSIARTGHVSIKVYDIIGREVAVLVNGVLEPGVYNTRFNASGLSSGIYFCRLESDGVTLSRKMLLIK